MVIALSFPRFKIQQLVEFQSIEDPRKRVRGRLAFQDGMNAGAWLLHDSPRYFAASLPTIISIGNSWAGDTKIDNPLNTDTSLNPGGARVSTYAYNLWRILKGYQPYFADPFVRLQYGTDGVFVMKSLARMENGSLPVADIPDPMYQAAILYGQSA